MKITITDVAKDSGVSIATVSNVLNNNLNVSAATAARVMDSVKKLGYVSNKMTKYQRHDSRNLIAFILPGITTYFSTLASIVDEALRAKNYELILLDTHNSIEEECAKIEKLTGIVDGFIIASSAYDCNELKNSIATNYPVMFIDRKPKNCFYDSLVINNYRSLYQSITQLTAMGHTKIGYLSGDLQISAMLERFNAYKDAMAQSSEGFHSEWVRFLTSENNTFETANELIEDGCTAICAGNNSFTVKSFANYPWFKEKYKNIELVGFSDYELGDFAKDNISLICQPIDELGKLAAEQLLHRIKNPEVPAKEYILTSYYRPRMNFNFNKEGLTK